MQDEKLTDGQKDLQVIEGKVSNETFPAPDVSVSYSLKGYRPTGHLL